MNDIEALRDYIIADEILRIQSLSHEELVGELINLQSERIETTFLEDLLRARQLKK
jgi:hypothetical protein